MAKVWRCCDLAFADVKDYVAHNNATHLTKPVTTEPQPMYYFVLDGEIVGSALDLEDALARQDEFPQAEVAFHLAYKRVKRRERNSIGADS